MKEKEPGTLFLYDEHEKIQSPLQYFWFHMSATFFTKILTVVATYAHNPATVVATRTTP
jgi:hypothetical protein